VKKTPFIWLGANRARKWPVGEKALLLDKAASAGLPVPAGAILLDELFQVFVAEGVMAVDASGVVTVVDLDWLFESLYDGIRFPRFDKPIIMRPAFSALADVQQSVPASAEAQVDMNDPDELGRALCRMWSVLPNPEHYFRRDVLVMERVTGKVEGTAVSTKFGAGVTNSDFVTDSITSQTEIIELPQLTGFFSRTDSRLPPYAQRLQKLLRGIRRTFGQGSWQVDWLDDGEICWVVKVEKLS